MERKSISSRGKESSQASPTSEPVTRTPSTSSRASKSGKAQPSSSGTLSKAFLSCELCRSRKIKCDKAEGGCSNCKRAGVKCIAFNRQRLPRGRNGGRKTADVELKARVAKLENLVRVLESEKGPVSKDGKSPSSPEATRRSETSPTVSLADSTSEGYPSSDLEAFGRYMSPNFWHSLSTEINGLRDVLQEDSDEDEEPASTIPSIEGTEPSFIFGLNALTTRLEPLQHPPRVMIIGLCEIYLRSVDLPFKILHAPTLRAYMREERTYLNYRPGSAAVEALSFGVYLAAVTSLTEQECYGHFGLSRETLCQTYCASLERALAQTNFVTTRDVTVLQAFMLYLKCMRFHTSGRFTWTLLSMAVRIAYDMNLHQDDIYSRSPFEAEMRRRLWAHVFIADAQAARDRGSEPMIRADSFTTPPPLNINDVDLILGNPESPQERTGVTNTSLMLIEQLNCHVLKQLAFVTKTSGRRPSLDIDWDWDQRLQLAHGFRQRIHEQFLQYCNYDIPLHCALRDIVEVMHRNLLVYVFRPLERHPRSAPPPVTDEQLLNITGAALESFEVAVMNPICEQFRWFGVMNNQWHTLAVMVAELCVCPLGPAADRSWSMLEPMMLRSRSNIAEGEAGMLWRPLEKMVRRAREVRKNAVALNPVEPENEPTWPVVPSQSSIPSGNVDPPLMGFSNLQVSTAPTNMTSRAYTFTQPPEGQTPVEWTSWSWPADYEGMVGTQDPSETSGTGLAAWESFLGGLQRDETPLPEMAYDPSIGPNRRATYG